MNPSSSLSHLNKIKKFFRYCKIFSFRRALTKTIGRSNVMLPVFKKRYLFNKKHIFLIGCGQFQFSTIAYFLSQSFTNKFYGCYDIDTSKSKLLSYYYNIKFIPDKWESILLEKNVNLIYIASNHHSHAEYAIKCLNHNKDVYSEKPLVVEWLQYEVLFDLIDKSKNKFFAGYNRPFSKAIHTIKKQFQKYNQKSPTFTLNYYINGHAIPEDHWYRDPKEGTRVCGNIGHWIDLSIHILNWRTKLPRRLKINISYSDIAEADDNIVITMTTYVGDLINIAITSRTEPFEGISESINMQLGDIIARIDDFRSLNLWLGSNLIEEKYSQKDVGHKQAVLQPFKKNQQRSISEIKIGSYMMLYIKDMVMGRIDKAVVDLESLDTK